MSNQQDKTTDFGFQEVPWSEKKHKVGDVFRSVANKYDLMNDLMSFGIHRLWKCFALGQTGLKKGDFALDLAGGTGDLSQKMLKQVGTDGLVILSDINEAMLKNGREKLDNLGLVKGIAPAQLDAEQIPFADNTFDCITIGFGLRNVTDKNQALREMYRCLKPGGRALILEFSKPLAPCLSKVYDAYSFHILPKLGKWVAKDEDSYRYLAESIRKHPDQATLAQMMQAAGFEAVNVHNLSGGIVALHKGYKL